MSDRNLFVPVCSGEYAKVTNIFEIPPGAAVFLPLSCFSRCGSLRPCILQSSGRILECLRPNTGVFEAEYWSVQGRILEYSGPNTAAIQMVRVGRTGCFPLCLCLARILQVYVRTRIYINIYNMQKGNIGVTTENIFPVIKKFLYSDHEIFLREMVSNAVDATQKIRTLA